MANATLNNSQVLFYIGARGKSVYRAGEIAVGLRVIGRGPQCDLRRRRGLLTQWKRVGIARLVRKVIGKFGHHLRRARAVALREHQRTQHAERVGDVAGTVVLDALVPHLAVGPLGVAGESRRQRRRGKYGE